MSSGRSVSACYSASSGWACLAQSLPCPVSVLPGHRWECDVRQPIAYWPRYSDLISPAEPAQSALMVALYTSLAKGLRPFARQRHSGLCRSSAVYKGYNFRADEQYLRKVRLSTSVAAIFPVALHLTSPTLALRTLAFGAGAPS